MNEPDLELDQTLKAIHILEIEQQDVRSRLFNIQHDLSVLHHRKQQCLEALNREAQCNS